MRCMTTKHPHRLRNFSYIGKFHYLLTWCCDERKQLFNRANHVDLVIRQILRASLETEFENIAYCYMPDHLHQLVKGKALTSDACEFIRKGKQYSGFYFQREYHERLWQRDGHDRLLLSDDAMRAAIRYIIDNPVRAGLVRVPEEYPFTGSDIYTVSELAALGRR